MVRRLAVLVAAIISAVASLTACGAVTRDAGPTVVVTTNILGDVVSEVVGDEAEVVVLMPPAADPHSFEISARTAATVEGADLVVSNGLGLEEGIQNTVDAAADAGVAVLPVAERTDPLPYAAGDSAGQHDPHFWTDPVRVRTAVRLVADQVTAHVPGVDATVIARQAASYERELDALDAEMRTAFGAIPADRRNLVTNHHVLGYLADRYGFEVVGAVIPSGTTLASPSAADLDDLATTVRRTGVPAVFADSSQPDRLAQVLAETARIDVEVVPLYSESLTADGEASTYLGMMRANAAAIARGLTP
ncbi:zinc ABC transporter substrate-binding protein [Mumia zhuanghuii]|uniref:Zinc ABC transporter substrate-binding protein AztC n=2 Tax=Mumia TaxID=1546255 RepID=A0ABW1QPJ4_9ACTN|nr:MULTISPECIES: zinc ABC transporter substrate-binding protein AztC [Mumia]KAA1424437.1 zinc ABC transporter substrate-binding protein [Mumia zhuanghuii]